MLWSNYLSPDTNISTRALVPTVTDTDLSSIHLTSFTPQYEDETESYVWKLQVQTACIVIVISYSLSVNLSGG